MHHKIYPVRTRTDMALPMNRLTSSHSTCRHQKITLLTMFVHHAQRPALQLIFNFRLNIYFVRCTGQLGFIPDICRILVKIPTSDLYDNLSKQCHVSIQSTVEINSKKKSELISQLCLA